MAVTILIVEDEALLARNLARFLERRGYEATVAVTVKQGIAQYGELHPDIVLIDHNLPDGTGMEVIRHVRQTDGQTRLVMITAHGGVTIAVDAMKAGPHHRCLAGDPGSKTTDHPGPGDGGTSGQRRAARGVDHG